MKVLFGFLWFMWNEIIQYEIEFMGNKYQTVKHATQQFKLSLILAPGVVSIHEALWHFGG